MNALLRPTLIFGALALLLLAGAPATPAAITLTENFTLAPDDPSLDGQDVVVDTATLTVAGPHAFGSLALRNGAVLTHPPAPAGEPAHAIRLVITRDLVVDAASRIDATARGYAEPGSPGAGARGDYAGAGGGHGGRGHSSAGSSPGLGGAPFGSLVAPDSWGGPGGNGGNDSLAPGGGVVHLEVGGNASIAGAIRADGATGQVDNQGGGAGGSVFLEAKTLAGNGAISANGASGEWVEGGGGAGGRIALLFSANEFLGTTSAIGGGGRGVGGAGTIYLKRGDSPGEVRIVNGGPGEWTPLASPVPFDLLVGAHAVVHPTAPLKIGNLTVADRGTLTHETGSPGLAIEASGNVTIASGGFLVVDGRGYPLGTEGGPGAGSTAGSTGSGGGHGGLGGTSASGVAGGNHYGSVLQPTALGSRGGHGSGGAGAPGGGAVRLLVADRLTIDGRLSAEGLAAGRDNAGGGAGGSLWVTAGSLAGTGAISVNGGAGEWVDGGGGAGGRIALYYTSNEFTGTVTAYAGSGGGRRGGAGTIYRRGSGETEGHLLVGNGGGAGNLTPLTSPERFRLTLEGRSVGYPESPLHLTRLEILSDSVLTHLTGQTNLELHVAGDLVIAAGAQVTADGKGYPVFEDTGPGAGSRVESCGSGGGHGGLGATSVTGAAGGAHYGSVTAPVSLGSQGGPGSGGPGAPGGGAIRLVVDATLRVDGRLSVDGAGASPDNAGGGAGGSLWLNAGSLTGTGTISANGGSGEWVDGGGGGGGRIALHYRTNDYAGALTAYGGNSRRGGAGTIYQQRAGTAFGQLLVHNGGVGGNYTPLEPPAVPYELTLAERAYAYPVAALELQSLVIRTNATLTHLVGQTNLAVHVLSHAVVEAGGALAADGRGYPVGDDSGPGVGQLLVTTGSGGGHGGLGGRSGHGAAGGLHDDSILAPVQRGSRGGPGSGGGGSAGGGAIRLVVDGNLALEGRVSVDGLGSTVDNSGGGAGGSIWITAGSLLGQGTLSANGGAGEWVDGGGGAGGRIALYYGTSQFAGALTAYGGGGSQRGGAGTIYQRRADAAEGQLLVHNGGAWGNYTPLTSPEPFRLTLAEMAYVYPESPLTVRDLDIRNNATLTHLVGQDRCDIHVLDNLTLAAAGTITADGRGYPVAEDRGPGAGVQRGSSGSGAGHGGRGGSAASGIEGGLPYGSYVEPLAAGSQGGPGSGGPGGAGGGVLRLIVDNQFLLDGRVSANGLNGAPDNSGGGAGGSVYLTAKSLAGSGLISVDGGSGEWIDGGGGAGGRIALHLQQNAFTGGILARGGGGSARGGAGTLYTRLGSEPGGILVLDNGGNGGALSPLDVPPSTRLVLVGGTTVYPVQPLDVVSLHLKPGATLTHTNGQPALTLRVAGDLTLEAGATLTATGKGYPIDADPGPGAGGSGGSTGSGGAHGGNGGNGAPGTVPGGVAHGSILEPSSYGSSGGPGGGPANPRCPGGGALRIVVGGTFALHGTVAADGSSAWYDNQGAGAGGSVWITAGTLLGAGSVSANGGNGEWVDGGAGGGGRIALHLGTDNFAGSLAARGGSGGHQKGGAGTIYTRLAHESVGRVLVENGGHWGAYTPIVAVEPFHLTLANRAQAYADGTLVVGSLVAAPETVLTHLDTQDAFSAVVLGDAVLDGAIDVTGRGYPRGADPGPGAGGRRDSTGSGAGHGGLGGRSASGMPGGMDYGSASEPTALGSQGGSGSGGPGGAGGGAVRLIVGQSLTLGGTITANGLNGRSDNAGGGSGGSVFLTARSLAGSGSISANGGAGEWVDGGGGAGGRVALYRTADSYTGPITVSGAGGSARGEDGTLHQGAVAGIVWLSPPAGWIAGETTLEIAFFTGTEGVASVEFVAWRDGFATPLTRTIGLLTAAAPWDTQSLSDGTYELEAIVSDDRGARLASSRHPVSIQNSVIWHAGPLADDETWEAGRIHAVRRDVTVAGGRTLTLAPGVVVKFLPGTRLILQGGATLDTPATAAQPVLLTSFLDDAAGGDSNLDGTTTRPQPGSWRFVLGAGATFAPNEHTLLRYHSQSYGGTLAADDTWSADSLREITDTVTVPSGLTLRIEAGAIVKFAADRGIDVSAGGKLVVAGTAVQPVVFTSIRDDAFGGDTNQDGSRTAPAAGDWRSLRIAEGASATLDHALVRFGGNSVGNPWGAGGALEALGGPLEVRNSVIADALKDGAFCYGTTRFENCLILRCDRGLTAVGTMEVLHCTVDACRIGLLEHVGQLTIRNSLVSRSIDAGIEHDLGGGVPVVTFCNVWNPEARRGNYSGVTDRTGQNGNLSAEPRFRDAEADNFRLAFASPGIDAADGAVAPEADFAGTPRYDDPRTGNTGTPAANGAVPDMGAFEFAETAPSNLDLTVASVNGPAELVAGSLVRLEWTILNRGAEAFTGPWHDAIYLKHAASGQTLRVAEPLVGRQATLGPGQTYTANAEVRVPGGVAGDYRWVVEANSRADIFEGANAANNEGASDAGSRLAVPVLTLDGTPVAGVFAAQEESHWFQVLAPVGRDVRIALDLSVATGVTELYVGRGFVPTPEQYSARQREWSAPDTSAVASGASDADVPDGTNVFYVLAVGRALPSTPQPFRIGAAGAAFDLESAAPRVVGNAGLVTLELRGAALTTNTTFALRTAEARRVAIRRSVRESGRVFATFDLGGLPAGPADLVAEAEGLQVVLPRAVEVREGGTPDFYATLSGPGTTRAGRFMTWFVTYGNRGLVDMKLPLLKFSAPGASEIRLYESTLDWADSFTFWGLNPEVLLPTLGPGQEVTFEVRVKSLVSTRITVAMMTGEQFAAETTPFRWSAIPPAPGADPARWADMVNGLDARLGATLGEYSALLEEDLAELAAGRLRYKYLANLNGAWLLGDELRGVPRAYPIIEVPNEPEDLPVAPAVHTPPRKIPGDGIRRTWFVIITMEDYSIARKTGGHPGAANTDNVAADSEDLWNYVRNDLRVPEEQSTGGHDAPGDDTVWNHDTILAAIRSFAGKVDADDNLVVVYSGHGGRGKRAGTGYLVGNGSDVSPVAFTQAIDAVGAGTTYFVNNSCHSEAFNELVKPGNTTFVGYAATKKDRIAWSDEAGSPMVAGFKGELRKCHSLGQSFAATTESVTKEYEEMTDVVDQQSPVLTNPSGASLDGKPWNDPAGISGPLGGAFKIPNFPGVVAGGTFTLVGSVDPNDKYALAGAGPQKWVHTDQVLPFEIVFENKTNAAAPAQEVLVTDDLDPRLDWSTFELKGLAFNDAKITVPAGLQRFSTTTQVGTDPYPVDVEIGLDPLTGRITWLLKSRDPATGDLPEDPYAGFLPPNDATRRGEGSLTYTIRPLAGLPDGTPLTNRATIVFDPTYGANPPILTPWVTNTIDAVAPSSAVQPLPAQGIGEILVQWTGSDAAGGSGIASYDLYVARDQGPYTPWLLASPDTSARFVGQPGSTYRFYSVARDLAGNTEAPPGQPDATIALGGGGVGPVAIAFDGVHVTITFTGTLQWAPGITGPWTDLAGVASPYSTRSVGFGRFFRARP